MNLGGRGYGRRPEGSPGALLQSFGAAVSWVADVGEVNADGVDRGFLVFGVADAQQASWLTGQVADGISALTAAAVVITGNMAKSGHHPELRDFLLGTGSRVLVEASSRERVWGIGLAADDDRGTSKRT